MRMKWWQIESWIRRRPEKILMWIVWRLPKKIVMWSAIRVVAHATMGQYGKTVVPELTAMDAVKRWETA